MRIFKLHGMAFGLWMLAAAAIYVVTAAPVAFAQTTVTGALSGVVTDATGAVVPNATVTLTNTGTSGTRVVNTNGEGRYTISNLNPGVYTVNATATGLQSQSIQVNVLVGSTVPADIQVSPTGNKTVVEVTATSVPLLDTQNVALATTFTEQQIQDLPTPGGDVTTVAFTAPGVVVNSGGSYGNFSSNGLPGISNLFVLNGFDNQDPFLNLNNSGSSNLTLGQGEEAEASVIQNAYNSQYGRAAGATINYVTKSGTNAYHGMLDYNYNGTVLNANGWFNNLAGSPRPHAVSNEWAANVGGPIKRDKLFFFADYEGLHYVLPNSGYLTTPSPQLEAYTMANIASEGLPVDVTNFATQTFNLYNTASQKYGSQPVNSNDSSSLGCGDGAAGGLGGTPTGAGGTFGVDTPCMLQGFASANNFNKEWLFTARLDWTINDHHKIYGRYKMDRGSQPTYTSYINPLFDAVSIQPEYEGQFNDSYSIGPNKTNVFVAAANWYSAYFGPASNAASLAVYPYFGIPDAGLDGSGTAQNGGLSLLGVPGVLTQGRNVTQYQIVDDFTWIKGRHTFRFGENFRRDLVSDYDQRIGTVFPQLTILDLPDFTQFQLGPSNEFYPFNSFAQAFTVAQTAHLALYNIGVYAQDEFQVLNNLKLTIGGRFDRTGNPLCEKSCFSVYKSGTFGAGTLNDPYNAASGGPIVPRNDHPFPSTDALNLQGRFGFNYSLRPNTAIRGGLGMFSDLYPASFIDGVIQNFPNYFTPPVTSGIVSPTGAGNVVTAAATANTTVQSGFANGQGWGSINNALVAQGVFLSSPPSIGAYFNGQFHVPMYLEYSLQVQQQLGRYNAFTITYAGNSGYNEVIVNPFINPTSGTFDPVGGDWTSAGVPDIGGIGDTPINQNYGKISEFTNNAHSNYNGLQFNVKHNGHGLAGEVSYTWSHALDDVSNAGVGLPWNGGSVTNQASPSLSGPLTLNYSNSDYDIRHNITGDVVYHEPYKSSNIALNSLLGGWVVGGKTYWRTGEPYSVESSQIGNYGQLGSVLMAQTVSGSSRGLTNLAPGNAHSCAINGNCLDPTQYVAAGSQTTFGNLRRNALAGPHYVNTDLNLLKDVYKHERMGFQIGASAYNVFNHANFAPPGSVIGSSTFGVISSVVAPPTSPYGSFQGAAVTQRVLVVKGRLTF
ncbi:MAG TPA: carboxypeptidase regulatory-like domain-containing protein [Terracidiphilus sp.]|nr:carboxypeptidase regulatory-like domain-containing protein [Terracidiphilus sp.]